MSGLGFKDFQVGEVLTSSDVDGYLMQQSVMRFADAAARGSALGTAPGTSVALAEGMVSYLDDTNKMEQYVTSWTPVGNLVQAVGTAYTATSSTTSSSFTASGLTLSITPVFADSDIVAIATVAAGALRNTAQGVDSEFRLARGTAILATAENRYADLDVNVNRWIDTGMSLSGIDSPATTSSVTYTVEFRSSTGTSTAYVNRNVGLQSSLVLMEVRP